MAKVKSQVGFGEASDYETLAVELDRDDVREQYIPAVTREVPVLDEEGNATFEDGIGRTQLETVTAGRSETLEEAFTRALAQHLTIGDIEVSGVENVTATISFTVSGSFDFDAQDFGIDQDILDELEEDDVDEDFVREHFDDAIQEAAREAAQSGWDSELEYEVDYVEAQQ